MRPKLVLGLMSGTSADGIDAALVEISGRGRRLRARLRQHCTFRYPAAVRQAILQLANAGPRQETSPAEVSQMNFLLGELAADAVRRACRRFSVPLRRVDLIGSHGQTVYHQGRPDGFLGRRIASTLQLGEPAVIAERTGIPVVGNFRPRDIAAGGQGAPLVPFVDYLLYRHARRGRVALNLGGIANVTVVPANAEASKIVAFDTGPGNMVIDAVTEAVTRGRRHYDRGGALARRGRVDEQVLLQLLAHPYFQRRPPKSAGREQFGADFALLLLGWIRAKPAADIVRTATELTVRSITDALRRFVLPKTRLHDLILGGGGARNSFLVRSLQASLPELKFIHADELGVEGKAKEAFAFAVLAYQTWLGEPATLPSATGARHAVVLGSITSGGRR